MHLRRLSIRALPGIEPGFTFEPAGDGVNVVTGPNAIGKSSLARALQYLLGRIDRRRDPPNLHLEAEFRAGDVRWTVRRTGRQVDWKRDGERVDRPPLPGARQFGLYRLAMESLLAADESDRDLADTLLLAVRGGFDLDVARVAGIGPRFARSDERRLLARRRELSEVQREYRDLQIHEANLPGLERRIEEAKEASALTEWLETALNLHEAIRKRQECGAALEGFPVEMAGLHGDEIESLKKLDEEEARLGEELEKARRAMADSARELKTTGLANDRPDSEHMAQVKRLLQRVERDSIEREGARIALKDAEARLTGARSELGGGEGPPGLDAGSLERARNFIEPLGDLRVRQREIEQRLEMAGTPPEQSEIDQLRQGVGALQNWLAAEEAGAAAEAPPWLWYASRTAWWATLTLAGMSAAAALQAGVWIAFGGALGAVVVLISVTWLGRLAATRAASPMDTARRRFAETGLVPPPEWSERSVREHLRLKLEARLNRLLVRQELAEGAARLRADLETIKKDIGKLETEKDALAGELGIDPELSGAPFLRFIAATENWDRARSDHAGREASLRTINARIGENAAHIRSLLKPWRMADAPPLGDSTATAELGALHVAFDALEARLSRAKEAEGAIGSGRDSVESREKRLQDIETAKSDLFARAGLESGVHEELARRIDRMEAWRQAGDKLKLAENEERRLRRLLAGEKALIDAVENDAAQELRQRLRVASDKAGEHTGLIQEQQDIKTLLQKARKEHKLERAVGELIQAEEALKDKREEILLHAATEVLLDDVERAFKTEREPDLLRKARERFERVTAHSFTLEFSGKTGFCARDLRQGEPRALAELSSGTRMQLLLALRMAWIEDRERGGESLPLFLDEALTTSDEDRFAVMAQTLSRLAESDGRQIFYLSARRHEAALWERATGSAPPVVDLAGIRKAAAPLSSAGTRIELPPSLPPPNGQDAESYAARIGVPVVHPRGDAGGLHVFHILRDDLPLLHRLMETWRMVTVGQLESLLASDAARVAISERQTRHRLLQRCKAARYWIELWRQGRGRTVGSAVLDESRAVSDIFLDRAANLARELEGDGEALVVALRAGRLKGFRTSKTDRLDEWLAANGYIDDAAVLESEERRRLILQHIVPPAQTDADDVNRVVDWMESAVMS